MEILLFLLLLLLLAAFSGGEKERNDSGLIHFPDGPSPDGSLLDIVCGEKKKDPE